MKTHTIHIMKDGDENWNAYAVGLFIGTILCIPGMSEMPYEVEEDESFMNVKFDCTGEQLSAIIDVIYKLYSKDIKYIIA